MGLRLSAAEARRLGVAGAESVASRIKGGPLRRGEDWPGTLAAHARAYALPPPEREYRFWPTRRWRFDLAWPEFRVAVEVDGGVYARGDDGQQGGRHQRPEGFERDCEKLSLAAAHGWRVLKVTPRQVQDGRAVEWLAHALLGGPPWK